jgi:hypothetical protein
MSQKNQGNKQSEKGMSKAHSGVGGKTAHGDTVGSSTKSGIKFPLPDHHGIHECNNPKTP